MKERTKILLVVAPTIVECRKTLDVFGVDPGAEIRSVTKAGALRGWSRGTPFICQNRDTWLRDGRGTELDHTLSAMMMSGQLRIASPRDLAEFQLERSAR